MDAMKSEMQVTHTILLYLESQLHCSKATFLEIKLMTGFFQSTNCVKQQKCWKLDMWEAAILSMLLKILRKYVSSSAPCFNCWDSFSETHDQHTNLQVQGLMKDKSSLGQ